MFLEKLSNFVNGLPENVKASFDDIISPLVKIIVEQATYLLLKEMAGNNLQDAKLTAIELYPVIDVKLEKLVKKTDTAIDDAVVEGVMKGIETFAKEVDLQLPNIDED